MMRSIGITLLAATISAFCGCRPSERERKPVASPAAPAGLEKRIFEAVNREREQRDLDQLAWSDQLLAPAREHSRRMAELGYFSHEDPERGSLPQRLQRFGVPYRAAGENLFMISGAANIAQNAVQGWMQSSAHREVMLNPEFEASAVGMHRTPAGAVYVTQIFTRPPGRFGWLLNRAIPPVETLQSAMSFVHGRTLGTSSAVWSVFWRCRS